MLKIGKVTLKVLVILFTIANVFYIQTEIYNFDEPKPFEGPNIYNPYQNWDTTGLLKANLHAHTTAWGGTTNGENSPKQLIEAYQEKDYDVIGISNYFTINNDFDTNKYYIPLYEHGLNIFKTHKQAINPSDVLYFDFPFFQNTSQKQLVINKLRAKDAVVAINHPKFMDGHTLKDLKFLSGYHFIEVLNHYRISDKYWDAALSSGKLVWLLANDDVHDLSGTWNHFVMWNMIAHSGDKKELLDNLTSGKSYGMKGKKAGVWNKLEYCKIIEDTLRIKFAKNVDSLKLIGQNGGFIKVLTKNNEISIPVSEMGPYTRCVANTNWYAIYLNPLVRFKENIPFAHLKTPKKNNLYTWLYRLILLTINLGFIYLILIKKR